MNPLAQPFVELLGQLRTGELTVTEVAEHAIGQATECAGNAYLFLDEESLRREAKRLDNRRRHGGPLPPLFGLPVSVKDLFDVRGQPTTMGSSFLPLDGRVARRDAAFVARWRKLGALLVGKTHLHEFAYGITGENPTWGPCLQPRDPQLLTGGSSSGAAASVQGGSAAIGLGTDTGGSIRVPAALCGLVGYRATLDSVSSAGVHPLARSFDTCGWLQRHVEDFPLIYSQLYDAKPRSRQPPWRLGVFTGSLLEVCEEPIAKAYQKLTGRLRPTDNRLVTHSTALLEDAFDIFAPIQAYEAARIHRKWLPSFAARYDPAVLSRLEWGLSISKREYEHWRARHRTFCRRLERLWRTCDLLIFPASPTARLLAADDHSSTRAAILKYTAPFSLGGLPVLTLPQKPGPNENVGWQVIAPFGRDARLAEFSRWWTRFADPSDSRVKS